MHLITDYRKFPEVASLKLLDAILPHPTIEKLLPDKRGKTYRIPGEFIVNIINSIEPRWLDKVMMACLQKRKVQNEANKLTKTVKVDSRVAELLFSRPYLS